MNVSTYLSERETERLNRKAEENFTSKSTLFRQEADITTVDLIIYKVNAEKGQLHGSFNVSTEISDQIDFLSVAMSVSKSTIIYSIVRAIIEKG